MPASVGAAANALLDARGDARKVARVFDRSQVPMMMYDDEGRYVDMNVPARLAARRSLAETRGMKIGNGSPREDRPAIDSIWQRLRDNGCVTGRFQPASREGGALETIYFGLADVLPGRHALAYAPASWPDGELRVPGADPEARNGPPLTPREHQVLQLAAEGLSASGIATRLVVSPATVKTHLSHIYAKLDVKDRTAAVATALRMGLID